MVHGGRDSDGFEPEAAPGADLDDVLDIGRAPPRWLRRVGTQWGRLRYATPLLVCAALVSIAIAAWTTVDHGARPAAAPSTELNRMPAPFNTAPLIAVQGLAHFAGTLPGEPLAPRPATVGACAVVTPGRSPMPLIGRAIRRIAPSYEIIDSEIVLDQFTGLCAIQVRAVNGAGDVLVVSTAVPPAYSPLSSSNRVETGIQRGPRTTTKYAWEISSTGFEILVGATGPPRGLPHTSDLVRLATQPALIW